MEATENHNIDSEKLFAQLLGYTVKPTDDEHIWHIFDEEENLVGHIQYKKFNHGNKRNGYAPVYGYCTVIDSYKIFYKNNRKKSEGFVYKFDVKRKDEQNLHVALYLNSDSSVTVWDNAYKKFWYLRATETEFHMDFNDKTENYDVNEIVRCENWGTRKKHKSYCYQMIAYDKRLNQTSPCLNRSIKGEQISVPNPGFAPIKGVRISTFAINQHKDMKTDNYVVPGTVEEMGALDEMGISAFNRFRFLINQALPFKQDIVPLLLPEEKVIKCKYQPFMPIEEKGLTKAKVREVK